MAFFVAIISDCETFSRFFRNRLNNFKIKRRSYLVHINGKDIDVAGQSLMDFLNANDYEMGTFVVECNEEIIHKEDYKTYILRDGDVIEVVQFMGGGCGTSLMYRSIM